MEADERKRWEHQECNVLHRFLRQLGCAVDQVSTTLREDDQIWKCYISIVTMPRAYAVGSD
ncbi:hypothetical protein QA641_14720 [Bradyrhizobium sp. CB1650]|uniref:hypothetical protein n=1 Tax=Bradyrhizobium sp. CB1650 TaxID=3039153 RepID=UPI002435DB23|nr:hypothetical protein [Bradyrhizobium sp. CB1650]WGD55041.1 hypothetical protein QA641_14720 [Bradyrhizobium sp. CB1650]